MKSKLLTSTFLLIIGGFMFLCIVKPETEFSNTERRKLVTFPDMSLSGVLTGNFMEEYEIYAADQFPFRGGFRRIKAVFTSNILFQKDNNDFYYVQGHLSKMDYPLNEGSLDRAMSRFSYIYEKYLKDTGAKLYFSIIPDKNYFLAERNGYLSMDYGKLYEQVKNETVYMKYIDITDCLSLNDYYRTDLHWKQEQIVDVAARLGTEMRITLSCNYETKNLENPFYGTYYGQAAMEIEPDQIKYLTNSILDSCIVYNYETEEYLSIYDMEKATEKDPYEIFLSGAVSLMTISNGNADTERELILFRDSFGSSIAPLLIEAYSKITLVDIRYIHPDMLERYIDFSGQDVLFLYSTGVLNHGELMK